MSDLKKVRYLWIPIKKWHHLGPIKMSLGLFLCILRQKIKRQCVTSDYKIQICFCKKIKKKNKPAMVYFLYFKVKTKAEDALRSLFD